MNYYDAQQIRLRHVQKQPVSPEALAEANAFVERMRREMRAETPVATPAPTAPPRLMLDMAPTYQTLCVCGQRYGMHRVNDFACMNQQWRPGNGQPQWTAKKWQRA